MGPDVKAELRQKHDRNVDNPAPDCFPSLIMLLLSKSHSRYLHTEEIDQFFHFHTEKHQGSGATSPKISQPVGMTCLCYSSYIVTRLLYYFVFFVSI
ncbi:hypothetical protein K435DRAFT_781593 [Dendrothele bispora CBS 962.96]|uniref:Uncharacterized protein n=1 Tax=Dendrothele bispora (strain CBS 962.96) TaxID=1314807 RepID=A0A4V4HE52_DENBC|nr:hypothetical protein K435DRAFT_781593 [Dendrothele bispora CBS 962.96]